MDPSKRAPFRPASDYRSRASDPQHVANARLKREDPFFTQPGMRVIGGAPGPMVANNSLIVRREEMEVGADNGRIYPGLYGDWSTQAPGINYARQMPAPPAARAFSRQPLPATEQLGDLFWAGKVNGGGGPLGGAPNAIVQDPGLMAEASRYPGTGQPAQAPMPPAAPMAMEDLQRAQIPLPPSLDMGLASRVEGTPADARFPSADARPQRGGMPGAMPQPKRS